ncbi:hypothetical protein ACVILL_007493 [Bradyrhizobium sp. USDA 3364]
MRPTTALDTNVFDLNAYAYDEDRVMDACARVRRAL